MQGEGLGNDRLVKKEESTFRSEDEKGFNRLVEQWHMNPFLQVVLSTAIGL